MGPSWVGGGARVGHATSPSMAPNRVGSTRGSHGSLSATGSVFNYKSPLPIYFRVSAVLHSTKEKRKKKKNRALDRPSLDPSRFVNSISIMYSAPMMKCEYSH